MTDQAVLDKIRASCALIKEDMENDVRTFTGRPFDGRTVGEMHGNLAAGIAALAGMVSVLAEGRADGS